MQQLEHKVDDPELGEITFKAKILNERIQARIYAFGLKRSWKISSITELEDKYEILIAPSESKITLCETAYSELWIENDEAYASLVLLAKIKPNILVEFLRWLETLLKQMHKKVRKLKVLAVAGSIDRSVLNRLGFIEQNGYYIKDLMS